MLFTVRFVLGLREVSQSRELRRTQWVFEHEKGSVLNLVNLSFLFLPNLGLRRNCLHCQCQNCPHCRISKAEWHWRQRSVLKPHASRPGSQIWDVRSRPSIFAVAVRRGGKRWKKKTIKKCVDTKIITVIERAMDRWIENRGHAACD